MTILNGIVPPPGTVTGDTFSQNLAQAAQDLIAFLQGLHATGVTLQSSHDVSVKRYEQYWLPLVSQHMHIQLVPPPDVAWVWHCHRLAPQAYEDYCQKRFRKILDSCPPFCYQLQDDVLSQCLSTIQLWAKTYGSNIPFFQVPSDSEQNTTSHTLDTFNLTGSMNRQQRFLWQVSQPCYSDPQFLHKAVIKYRRFLQLQMPTAKKGHMILVPTYQIDLVWHSHMLVSTTDYRTDCLAIRGEAFDHDDSIDDRTPGATLDTSLRETILLWRAKYYEEYMEEHGNYCGEPLAEFNNPAWVPNTTSIAKDMNGAHNMENTKISWADPRKEIVRHDQQTFIRAERKSRQQGLNRNPKKEGYVFGWGSMRDGYYSLETKDAYAILVKRLQRQYAMEMSNYNTFDLTNCLCLWGTPSQRQISQKTAIQLRAHQYNCMLAYVQARLEYDSPYGTIPEEMVKKHLKKTRSNMAPTDTGYIPATPLMFSHWQLCDGGGCGGGGSVGYVPIIYVTRWLCCFLVCVW
jgi:hypothetical protein